MLKHVGKNIGIKATHQVSPKTVISVFSLGSEISAEIEKTQKHTHGLDTHRTPSILQKPGHLPKKATKKWMPAANVILKMVLSMYYLRR